MKKFTLVPVGDCFEFQGEQYSKTGPLTATSLKTNRQRMIPRSAMVAPIQAGGTVALKQDEPADAFMVNSNDLRNAFEHYHAGCMEWLRMAEKELNAETAEQIREALETAQRRFLSDLGLN